jgi:hypothetical protein
MSTKTPTAVDRIDELKRLICEQVPVLIDDARDNITEAITAAMEEAQEKEEGKAVLSLAITAKWDLDGCAVVVSMPVNVRRKYEVTAMMDDPSQPPLPFGDGATVTIKAGDASATITAEGFKRIAKAAARSGDRARSQVEEGGAS